MAALVAAELDVEASRLTFEAHLADDLGVDSLAAIELGMVIEDEFDIAISEDRRERIRTYGDIRVIVATLVIESPDAGTPFG